MFKNSQIETSKLDPSGMSLNLSNFPQQVEEAEKKASAFTFPTHYIKSENIVIAGMGGSAIGGDLAKSLAYAKGSEVPIEILRDYQCPPWVSSQTLFIATSYSGETEETISAFEQAAKAGAKLLVISTGGSLSSLGRKYKAPILPIEFKSTPREALAFSFIPIVKILEKIGKIKLDEDEFKETILLLKAQVSKLNPQVSPSSNLAKQLAEKIFGKIPVIYAAGSLAEVARRWKTQFNENAKLTSFFEVLPELCHNSVVGFEHPGFLKDKLIILVLQSRFDHPRNVLRQKILFSILQERNIPYESIYQKPVAGILSEMLQLILLGDFTSYYLATLENIDPEPVEVIDYFKERLAASK